MHSFRPHGRQSHRLPTYDYAGPGAYLITIATQDRRPVLAAVHGSDVRLTAPGDVVRDTLESLPLRFTATEVDAFVIMPDHVHAVVVINGVGAGLVPAPTDVGRARSCYVDPSGANDLPLTTDGIAAGATTRVAPTGHGRRSAAETDVTRAIASHRSNDGMGAIRPMPTTDAVVGAGLVSAPAGIGRRFAEGALRPIPSADLFAAGATTRVATTAPALAEVIGAFKSLTTLAYIRGVHDLGWPRFPGRLWQRNYHERVIRDAKHLVRVRRYIEENPIRWTLTRRL